MKKSIFFFTIMYIMSFIACDDENKKVDVSSINLNETVFNLNVGETVNLVATVKPDNANDKAIIWTSDNEGVATVDENGVVTAKGKGVANIKASSKSNPSYSVICVINVSAVTTRNNNPSIPVLTSPLIQATNIKLNSTLVWNASTDPDGDVVKYYVIFSTDFPPTDTVSRLQTTTSYTPTLNYSTTYNWKIIASDGKGGNSVSETRSFTTTTNTNTNTNPPSIPNLLNPLNGSVNIPLNQVLNWNKSKDPDGDVVTYNVLFGTNATPTTSVSSAKTDTSFSPTLTSNTLYYWKIVASDATGLTSESEIRSFTTLNSNSTTITLFSPPNNSTKIKLNELLKWNEWKTTSGNTVKYTVYFGTAINPTTQVSVDQLTTTFTPTLTASTSYYWKVSVNDGTGSSNVSEVWKFTTVSNPPPKPVLTSPANSATNIALNTTLNWNAITDGTKTIKYSVYFGTASPPSKVESTLQTANSFTPTGLSGNRTYYWKIVVDNGEGGQTESDVWSFTTLNNPPVKPTLNSPVDLATNVSVTEALKWSSTTDPDGDVVNYNVYIGTTNPPTTKVTNTSLSSTSYNPTLNANTKYYWKVTAEDGKGGVTESVVRSFTTGAVPSTTPVLITPNNNALNIPLTPIPTLSWNASVGTNGGAVTYNVYFGTSNPPSKVTVSPQSTRTYTPTNNLLSNTTYYWKVEAIIANEGNFNSEIRQFKTEIVPPSKPVLSAPANNATNVSLTPSLSWTASTSSSGYSINYKVYLGTTSNPSTVVSNSQTAISYTSVTALISNTTYYWKIEANDGNGGVTVSEISNFKTIVPPSVPVLTSPSKDAIGVALNSNLTWTASTSSTSNTIKYNVYFGTDVLPINKVSDMQAGTSYTPTLLSNTDYYWKVNAVDGNGAISESEVWHFKTLLIPPTVPNLKSIKDSIILVNLDTTFNWNICITKTGKVAKYNVYLDVVNPPLNKVSSLLLDTFFKPTLTDKTTYYWKIEADDGNGGISVSEVRTFNTMVLELVFVEGGTFTMGCIQQWSECSNDYSLAHSVTLSSFSIGKYEITQFQWVTIMNSNPSTSSICDDCPVESVSWYNVQDFITKLNTKSGKNFRLVTESEWEYAARGGNKSKYYKYSGSNILNDVAWTPSNSDKKTHSVGSKAPNELGIYDMTGNVWEWCSDWFSSYPAGVEFNDPIGPETGEVKSLRGGSWFSVDAYDVYVFNRGNNYPSKKYNDFGFRIVLPNK